MKCKNNTILTKNEYTGIHHSKYWIHIHYDTIEDGQNRKLIFYSLSQSLCARHKSRILFYLLKSKVCVPFVNWKIFNAVLCFTQDKGTVVAASKFDPQADAEKLRKAMKGFGTDEKAIIEVVTQRDTTQRQKILKQFKQMFGKVIISIRNLSFSHNFF